jgi:hypothetical protein
LIRRTAAGVEIQFTPRVELYQENRENVGGRQEISGPKAMADMSKECAGE